MSTFVQPRDLSASDRLKVQFRRAWPVQGHVAWLVKHILCLAPCWDEVSGDPDKVASLLVSQLRGDVGADAALCRFLTISLAAVGDRTDVVLALADGARTNGIDLRGAFQVLKEATSHSDLPSLLEIAVALVKLNILEPAGSIDWDALCEGEADPELFPRNWGTNCTHHADTHEDQLIFWLRADISLAGTIMVAKLREPTSPDRFARLARAFVAEIGKLVLCRSHDRLHSGGRMGFTTDYKEEDKDLRQLAVRLLEITVDQLDRADSLKRNPDWIAAVLWLWIQGKEGGEEPPSETIVSLLLELSKRHFGNLRADLAKSDAESAPPLLVASHRMTDAASRALFSLESLWGGLKPLLLLVRFSPVPVFTRDLGWLHATGDDRPAGVGPLAQFLMFRFQAFSRREQDEDKALAQLRVDFGHFCIERLKTSKRHDGPVEPDAVWRYAYVRALVELDVNPGGKGHRVIHHLIEDDSDSDVRQAAEQAYRSVQHAPTRTQLSKGSHRKAILGALWWIRQAHRLSLGLAIDEAGAIAMREEELRYTALARTDSMK